MIVPIIGIMLNAIPPIIAPSIVPARAYPDAPDFFIPANVIIHSSSSPSIARPAIQSRVFIEIAIDHVTRLYSSAPIKTKNVPPIPTIVSPTPISENKMKTPSAIHWWNMFV